MNSYRLIKVFLILICLSTLKPIYAQTYIEPIIGYGLSKTQAFENEGFELFHVVTDERINNGYFIYGIGVTQIILEKIAVELRYKRSKLEFGYFDTGIVGWTDFRLKRHEVSLIPNLQLFDKIEFGIGANYRRLYAIELGKKRSNIWSDINKSSNQSQLGWIGSIRYKYKNFNCTLEYSNGKSINLHRFSNIERTNAIELSLGYRIKVFNKIEGSGKKSNCPKF